MTKRLKAEMIFSEGESNKIVLCKDALIEDVGEKDLNKLIKKIFMNFISESYKFEGDDESDDSSDESDGYREF